MTKRVQRRPYLTPQPDRMQVGIWMQQLGRQTAPLGTRLPGWDAGTNLDIGTEVLLDLDGIYQDCRLGVNARLRLVAIWESSGTKLRGSSEGTDLAHTSRSIRLPLNVSIDGKQISEALVLTVKLLFISPGRTTHHLVPKLAGSVLLESSPYRVQLEGEGTRFPMEIVDFTTTNFPPNAGWMFFWDPDDLHQTVLGDVRLYLNSRHPQIAAAAENQPETAGVREAVRLDLAQIIIRGALTNDEFVQNPDQFAAGSIGAAARAMIRMYFDGYSLESLQTLMRSPHQFSAYLQEKLKIFRDEQ